MALQHGAGISFNFLLFNFLWPDWINYAIIDDIVDSFAPLIRQVETEVDMIDELVLILKESEQADMLRRIGNCRKRVMSLLRLLTGKADVIKGLIKRYEGRMGRKGMGEIGLFMGDIQGRHSGQFGRQMIFSITWY